MAALGNSPVAEVFMRTYLWFPRETTKRSLSVVLIFLFFSFGCTQGKGQDLDLTAIGDINATDHSDRIVRAQGTVKRGIEIGTDYYVQSCPDPIFLQDDSGARQIAIETEDDTHGIDPLEEYLGKKVEVIGTYTILSCDTVCDCDGYIAIERITPLE
jgi:hypothetical protein